MTSNTQSDFGQHGLQSIEAMLRGTLGLPTSNQSMINGCSVSVYCFNHTESHPDRTVQTVLSTAQGSCHQLYALLYVLITCL